MAEALTLQEGLELNRLEAVIQQGLDAVIEAGVAIGKIRDQRLYRAQYETWEQYCRARWQRTPGRINQIIRGAQAVLTVGDAANNVVITPRAATALGEVPEDQRRAVLEAATVDGRVTAAGIAQAARNQPDVELDETNYPVPHALAELWNRRDEVDELMRTVNGVRAALRTASRANDPLFSEMNFDAAIGDLERAVHAMQATKPFAVCMQCQGHPETQQGGCRLCRGRGLISEFKYRTVPEELRAMREGGDNAR